MSEICSCCGDKLKGSKYYQVISRDAKSEEQKDKEKKIDELQENGNEDEIKKVEEEKEKKLEAYKAELRDLDDTKLDDLLESLRAEVHELRKKLHPEETNEEKQSKEASLEYLAIEPPRHNKILGDHLLTGASVTHQSNYSVLMFDQSYRDKKPGDKLLIKLGSVD